MKPLPPDPQQDTQQDNSDEIHALIETLHDAEQRLEELTSGEVDTVSNHAGRTMVLQRAQEKLRQSEAVKQAAILNALPAHIALLDSQGGIASVNQTWRYFASANELLSPKFGVGMNYLEICDTAHGDNAAEVREAAIGLRAVLAGTSQHYSIEYPCHSPSEQRWFQMTVTPVAEGRSLGAVVMHLDITEKRHAAIRLSDLNRVLSVQSGINSLIVRVQNRDELFRGACDIAIESGGFKMAMLGIVDRATMELVLVAGAGVDDEMSSDLRKLLVSKEAFAKTLVARAIQHKETIVSNDSSNDIQLVFREKYAERGICSLAVLPLLSSGEAIGALAVFSGEAEFFHAEEMSLLTQLTDDIVFAMDHIGKQDKLNYLAYYDSLTGLANRGLFLERVSQYLRSAESGGHKLAVGLIDIERFKNINDSLGRTVGDVLLKQVAEWMTQRAGDANLLAHIDADHFAVVLPEVSQAGDLAQLVGHLLDSFQAHSFRLAEADYRIGFKAGVAVFPDDGTDVDTLLKNAEAALKMAKAGGNRYLFHSQKMTEAVAEKLALENELRDAIDNQQFVLHYQPKVDLATGVVTSAEALIRWNHPKAGLVPPGKFIAILEQTGMIYEVGRWAMQQAITDYLRWRRAGRPDMRIAVNVSPLQLRNHEFIAQVDQLIGSEPGAAAGLELEITENLIMEDVGPNIAILTTLRAMGVTVAIDDFGTGSSSLSHLAKLPVDTLKIDRSFVVDMTASSQGLALVSTIITLAHSMKLKVVAEGVETEEQKRLLRLLGCDEMQGFLFSKAVPADEFEARFLTQRTH